MTDKELKGSESTHIELLHEKLFYLTLLLALVMYTELSNV